MKSKSVKVIYEFSDDNYRGTLSVELRYGVSGYGQDRAGPYRSMYGGEAAGNGGETSHPQVFVPRVSDTKPRVRGH